MPFEYVHRAESRRLEREEEAEKVWALRVTTMRYNVRGLRGFTRNY